MSKPINLTTLNFKLAIIPLLFLLPFSGSVHQELSTSGTEDAKGYVMDCESENFAFLPGEELVYKIYYNLNFIWIPAGELHFQVFSGESTYEFTAYGTTYPSYEWFYKVDDVYRTTVDKETLLPIHAMRHIKEGKFQLYEEIDFDQDGQIAQVIRGRDKESAEEKGEISFDACASDIVSLMYRLRNIDRDAFVDSGQMPISFVMGTTRHDINLRFLGEEHARIKGLGKLNTLKVSPSLIEGDIFKEGDEMITWVSDDSNRVPLMIESPLSVGSAKAVLKSYSGLKHPFDQ